LAQVSGYLDAVAAGWQFHLDHTDAFWLLDHKLWCTAQALRSWSSKFVGSILLQLVVAREVVFKLEQAQDKRQLLHAELELCKELKFKLLGLASLSRTSTRQRSRLTFLREGDAHTKFFHLEACHRSRKNFIDSLQQQGMTIVGKVQKEGALFQHFDASLAIMSLILMA
jgi:hypothetical protein